MRDFDELLHERLSDVEARQFSCRGYEFTLRASIRPEAMQHFLGIMQAPDDIQGAAAFRSFLEEALVDGDLAKWDKLREIKGDEAVNVKDMVAIAQFALEAIIARPPTRLDSSGDGSKTPATSTGSTEPSPLRVAGSGAST